MLETFDLSLMIGPRDEIWVSAFSRHGAVHGVPRVGGNLPSLAELGDVTEDFEDAIQYARDFRGVDVGTALRELVFGEPEIMALFHRSRGAAADQGRQVVVRILAPSPRLSAVPWELIVDPEGGNHQFLTLAPDVHVVRAARSRTYPAPSELLQPPLNVLLILSSPRSLKDDDSFSFDLFEEKRNLLSELETLQANDILRIDVEEHPTLENLRRRIGSRRGGYHIVHYLGHATPGGLYLEDREGRATLTNSATVTELLRLCPQLRLCLFAGCETARSPVPVTGVVKEWRDGLSIADQCVRVSCPVVIGMRAILPFRTEWLFARFFYQGLASGYAVVDAVRLARAAIRGDDFVGGELLDWAVPSVIAGSDQLGPILEPPKAVTRRPRPKFAELKFDLIEEDRDFFSRLVPLRGAIDVLGGTGRARVLTVTGPLGVGKTALVDRALQDLGPRVDCVLYFKVERLLNESDPVLRMASWVAELLTSFDQQPRLPQDKWDGMAWWERLLSDLTTTRFVIVIDDLELLRDSDGTSALIAPLAKAIQLLADRRGNCRLALIAAELPQGLVDPDSLYVTALHLRPFRWEELWVWIRRNLPVLTRYGKAGLAEHYTQLGNDLKRWRELATRVGQQAGVVDLQQLVGTVSGLSSRAALAAEAAPPAPPTSVPRSRRALRVAVAGPFIKSAEAFARSMTSMAAQYGVGGRVVTSEAAAPSSLAELLPIASPFSSDQPVGTFDILKWLVQVESLQPDIVLLDYGSSETDSPQTKIIERLASNSLMIAAAGNEGPKGNVSFPARLKEVLAVGALESPDTVATYSSLNVRSGKPELHALGQLADTPLAAALTDPEAKGTSFAALQVVAAAALTWSTNPAGDRLWVRDLLLKSARSIRLNKRRPTIVRGLDITNALILARGSVVLGAIGATEVTYAQLQGRVGFAESVLDPVIKQLQQDGRIRTREQAGVRRYQLVNPDDGAMPSSTTLTGKVPVGAATPTP